MRPAVRFCVFSVLILGGSGCGNDQHSLPASPPVELRIGYGRSSGQAADAGVNQAVANLAREALVSVSPDGRYQPWVAQSVAPSTDGLTWRIELRPNVRFHDGTEADAAAFKQSLTEQLARIPTIADNVAEIVVGDKTHLDLRLKHRSNLIVDALGEAPSRPGNVGTGPFTVASKSGSQVEMVKNKTYYGGDVAIDRIVITPYETVRAAWAEMLRGNVDMLYEVGVDALDSLGASSTAKIYSALSPYALLGILNTARPALKSPAVRRALNAAMDRDRLVAESLGGHGRPATGPVSPLHWANGAESPGFSYAPARLVTPIRLTILYADSAYERIALLLKSMLEPIGAVVTLEQGSVDDVLGRVRRGDFDVFLADAIQGPGLLRPSFFWRTGEQFNWGHYSNRAVDKAFDDIQAAPNDDAYRAGVRALQQAIVDDPPAIFLAWSERARAVSTRFEVPIEPGRDILRTLRLWKLSGGAPPTN